MTQPADLKRRFGGIAKLYGDKALAQFMNSHVCVIGVGGVGSWACESLARSGVGEITMIDMDIVSESNINRQLPAMTSTVGRDKTAVLAERIHEINPECKVHIVDDFLTIENFSELLTNNLDFVIDCIDNSRVKAAMINHCKRQKIKIITLGGAGGKIDPSRIKVCDLTQTKQDPLLSTTRRILRQKHNFTKTPKKRFGVPCVYSDEVQVYGTDEGTVGYDKPTGVGASLSCAGGLGSCTTITATFALFAVSEVLKKLVANA